MSRFDRKEKNKVKVTYPSIVTTYNKFMGGVDLLDGLLSLNTEYIWDQRSGTIGSCSTFLTWLLCNRGIYIKDTMKAIPTLKLREFKMQIADCMVRKCKMTTNKRGRPSTSNVEKKLAAKKGVTLQLHFKQRSFV